ncbi:MAG TPA: hypothetical protein VK530_15285, partial [Candidatus Acidoferrum sp.]|nr:hypothetical protein [Candidatus Acidoferrum sp.]
MNIAVIAHLAGTLPGLALNGDQLPAEIQWMPAGKHKLTALNKATGEPLPLNDIEVNEAVAKLVASQLQYLRAQAAAGLGDLPFIDFNHEDGAASGHPTEFSWGGTDPKTGGIRAKMEWTGSGKTALLGKDYRRFSPEFAVDP